MLFFNELWNIEHFFPQRNINFCGINASIPFNPHYFLSKIYGDKYMVYVVSKNWCNKTESRIQCVKTISYLDYKIYADKPCIQMDFELHNLKNNIIIPKFFNNSGDDIGIILAGGFSTRFKNDTMKQLFYIDGKKIIEYSVDAMNQLNNIIIVTNDKCFNEINKLYCANNKITILINNINCRLESIKVALDHIGNKFSAKNIVIHDVARPYIQKNHITKILNECNDEFVYSQYCLKLTNGLLKMNDFGIEFFNRDEYIETCTPICINYELASFIYKNYIDGNNKITCEFLHIIDIMKLKYKLLFDNNIFLKKITFIDDIIVSDKLV